LTTKSRKNSFRIVRCLATGRGGAGRTDVTRYTQRALWYGKSGRLRERGYSSLPTQPSMVATARRRLPRMVRFTFPLATALAVGQQRQVGHVCVLADDVVRQIQGCRIVGLIASPTTLPVPRRQCCWCNDIVINVCFHPSLFLPRRAAIPRNGFSSWRAIISQRRRDGVNKTLSFVGCGGVRGRRR
jgi:hypothetical protein